MSEKPSSHLRLDKREQLREDEAAEVEVHRIPQIYLYNLSWRLLRFLVFLISFLYLCFFILSLLCLFTEMA